jgi:rod shape-determining protein MreC
MKKIFILSIIAIILVVTIVSVPLTKNVVSNVLIKVSSKTMASFSDTGRGIGNKFSFFGKIRNLNNENRKLADKLIELEVDKSRIIELEKENELLKNELGFASANAELKLLPARVIGREPTSFLDHIIIDKGNDANIIKGMAVISSGVLVGQVNKVYESESEVILITSKDSLILAMLQNSRAKGVLSGGISGLMLQNIAQDVKYEKDENIVTSGLDGELKPGILIGKTGALESSTSDLFKNISVEPLADLSKLEMVFIIQ